MADLTRHLLAGVAHRQARPRYRLLDHPRVTPRPTRWVERGEPPALYLSDTLTGAWAELSKHHDGSVDPSEVVRRVGAIRYRIEVVDLCDPDVRKALDVDEHDLVRDDDLTVCRALASAARQLGLQGLVSPSAALATARTIVVFETGFDGLTVVHEEVRSPPPG